MKIIIPMAGRGSRLRPHTLTVPKPLVPVAGKPIVQRLIEDLTASYGESVEEIAFIIGDFGQEAEDNLMEIAKELNTKGSIYHHFKSKEELALECLKYIHEHFDKEIFSIAYRKQLSSKEKLVLFTKKIEAYFLNSEGGCLLGNFALEISNNIPLLKNEIIAYFKAWEESICQILKPEIGKKEARKKAMQIVAATQGSIMLMRLYGNSEPFKIQNRAIIDLLN